MDDARFCEPGKKRINGRCVPVKTKSSQELYDELILIDNDNPVQIEKVRGFLTGFRNNNYTKYGEGRFEFEIFSNCIMLLAEKKIEIEKNSNS